MPLLVSGEVVGAMSIGSPSAVSYGDDDLATAQRIAAHLAGAIAHERLKGLREPETRELGALTEMGRLIAACSDVSEVYEALTEQVRVLLPFDRLEVATVDLEKDTFIRRFSAGTRLNDGGHGVPLPMAGTMVEQAVRSGSPVLVEAATAPDVLLRLPSAKAEAEAGLRSFLGVPLVSNGETVGAYILGALEPRSFAESDLDLSARAGLQLAGALANARLRAAQIADAEELAGLAEIGRVVTSSVDIDEVYDTLSDRVERLVRFDRLAIWTVDLLRQNLVVSYLRGADEPGFERGRSFPLARATGRGLLASQSGAVVKEETARAMSERFPGLVAGAGDRTPEVIIVPLLSGGEHVGMLTLKAPADEPYADRDVAVAERIAAQIAGPVANAQVYLETKQVEAAVKKAVERLDLAVWGSGDGLWDWNFQENEVWWSPKYKELLRYQDQDESGLQDLASRIHPDDRDWVIKAQNDHLERRLPYDVEYRLQTALGDYRWFNDRGQAIWDRHGEAIRMSGAIRDVHDAKEAGLPSYTGPYDLLAPLAIIEGFKQAFLKQRTDDDGDHEYISDLASVAQPIARLAQDLSDLDSVMEATVEARPVNLTNIVRSVVRRLRRGMPEHEVTFSLVRGQVVEGDPTLLRLMMDNLLSNAWKFAADEPDARVEFGVTEVDGRTVHYVRDNGVGFDMVDSDRLFKLFQSIHGVSDYEGTGVGLAAVAHIVRLHGGSIWAEGETGKGATFFFTL